jgi:predicted transcriptional regulator
MNWEQILEKHTNEFKEFLNNSKNSYDALLEKKDTLIRQKVLQSENTDNSVEDVLSRDFDNWQKEWGIYGQKNHFMRMSQQEEISRYYLAEKLKKELTVEAQQMDHSIER